MLGHRRWPWVAKGRALRGDFGGGGVHHAWGSGGTASAFSDNSGPGLEDRGYPQTGLG